MSTLSSFLITPLSRILPLYQIHLALIFAQYGIFTVPTVKEKPEVDSMKAVKTDVIQDYCCRGQNTSVEKQA